LICRDVELLAELARVAGARVNISVPFANEAISHALEPYAPAPAQRLATIARLAAAGIPTGVMVAPIIPGLNDHEIEAVLEAAAEAGAGQAAHTLVRLPHEVKELFAAWLEAHAPLRAEHILSLIRQCRGGRLNDPNFGSRMRGQGAYAELIGRRVAIARRRFGLTREHAALRTDLFERPHAGQRQLRLL
jgi:DNA repair photolyase